jgi:hypothetical protein
MGRTPKKVDAKNSGKRGPKRGAKDAKNEALEPASQQAAETADEVQPPADVVQNGGNVAETQPSEPRGVGDGQETGDEGVEPDDGVGETDVAEVASGAGASGTSHPDTTGADDGQETGARGGEPDDGVGETETAEATSGAAAAAVEQAPVGDGSAVAQPETETAASLAMRRFREHPTCCCGCGQKLSGPKKHFIQGHDGRAKKIIRRIMKGELPAGEAPTELILRHAEIKFITRSPEYHKVIDLWREMCGAANTK